MTEHVKIKELTDLKLDQLREAADHFAATPEVDATVVLSEAGETKLFVDALIENGVTAQMYNDFLVPKVIDEPEVVVETTKKVTTKRGRPVKADQPEVVLLKMTRENPRYDIRGVTFTQTHPYHPVLAEDADWIVQNVEGFRPATNSEAQAFYDL